MPRTSLVTAIAIATALILPANIAIANDPGSTAKAGPDRSKRVCRNVTPTGSRMTKRVCRTQAEWDAEAERAARLLQDGQINGSSQDGQNRSFR